ncbi:MAG: quinone-dependent dihydroorotate dehydrogenase [Pirellulaceae bacterium]|nr:quinone-dependent dihydroorotate dehydrogenase [Pirellulaceae bacterium]
MSFYTTLVRRVLFRIDAEKAHHWTIEACRFAGMLPIAPRIARRCFEFKAPELETEVAGLKFPNPIGLAAGWDKSGRALKILDNLGFGFVELGSISARPSVGNPKPRLFRLPQDRAIVVNYGLPNDGAEVIANRIALHRGRNPVGINIVKTNDGPNASKCSDDEILGDYVRSVSLTHRYADYLMLNLSCPNAKGGKDFFAIPGSISRLLEQLSPFGITCPVFLKVTPNPNSVEIERSIAEADPFAFVRGFMFNLPTGKPASLKLATPRTVLENMPGAVSGQPVSELINTCIRELYLRMPRHRFSIIAAGGIFNAEDAYQKIRLGASLLQIYTALIYEGPSVVKRINRDLRALLIRDGFQNVGQAVGREFE